MAYDQEMDRALEESGRVQRERYAGTPVIPSARAQDEPTNTVGPEFGGPATETSAPAAPRFGIGGSIDYGAEFGIKPAPAAAAPVIAPAATTVRTAPAAAPAYKPQVSTEGAIIRRAVESDAPQSDPTQSYPAHPLQATPTMYQGDPNVIRARYDATIAASDQAAQDRLTAMRSQGQAAQASYDAGIAKREADVAAFAARNGADMILRGGNKQQKQAILDHAVAMRNRAEAAAGRASDLGVAANNAGTRNLVGDNALAQEGINRATIAGADVARANVDAQTGLITNAVAQQKLEQQRQISKLSQVLASSSADPGARKRAQDTILTLLGKDKPDQYKLHVVQRPDTLGPDGMTVVRGGQDLVMVGPDGRPEVVKIDQAAGKEKKSVGKPVPDTLAEYIAAMRADPRNAKFSDAELAAEYEKKGGGR